MRARRTLLSLALSLGISSCGSGPPEVEQSVELLNWSTVQENSTAGFEFLPPLVPAQVLVGTFDPNLSPIVRIDALAPDGTPREAIAAFTTHRGLGSERVRIDPIGPSYIVNWHTRRFPIHPGVYRISVLLEARVVGFVDVELTKLRGREIHGRGHHSFVFGQTIPIRFWMNTCVRVMCSALDMCHAEGQCDPSTGLCSNPLAPDGTACDDHDACTRVDLCQAGACTGLSPVVCNATDQCHVPGSCDPMSGVCSNPNAQDGTPCTDTDLCTQSDNCVQGACVGSDPFICTASDACHLPGTCDPALGFCSEEIALDGTPCDDGDACTEGDVCVLGACESGTTDNCGRCPSPTTTIQGVYSGTAVISAYWVYAESDDAMQRMCSQLWVETRSQDVELDVSGPPWLVSLRGAAPPYPLSFDLSRPNPYDGSSPWTLSPSALMLSNPWVCMFNLYAEFPYPALITFDPASRSATFTAHCEGGHLDACTFPTNYQVDWQIELQLRCLKAQTTYIDGYAVTCDENGIITSIEPCTTSPQPCAAPLQDACGSGSGLFCTMLGFDPKNCGECGHVCEPSEECSQGTCVPICSTGLTLCDHPGAMNGDRTCDSLSGSMTACGACNRFCEPTGTCFEGRCNYPCGGATPDACSRSYDTVEFCTDLSTDRENCGTCYRPCPVGRACSAGVCI